MNFVTRWLILALASIASATAATTLPPQSIYHLQAALTNQSGATHGLDVYRGHPVLITMFYSSCPAACPLLIDTVRTLEKTLNENQRAGLRVLMISIDPLRDTPQALAQLGQERRIDMSRWTLARADPADVRSIAALLHIQFRQLPNGDFNHSSIISALSAQGEIVAQSTTMGKADPVLREALNTGTIRSTP